MTDESQEHRKANRVGCGLLAVLMLTVLYILSPPFVEPLSEGVEELTGIDMDTPFRAFYTPLIFLYDSFESVRKVYDWYFELFPEWMIP